MPDKIEKKSKASGIQTISTDQRKLIGQAIIDGLIDPTSFNFINPLATEGGDYSQNGGSYKQSGGGGHTQGGDGGYDQSKASGMLNRADQLTNPGQLINEIQEVIRKNRER